MRWPGYWLVIPSLLCLMACSGSDKAGAATPAGSANTTGGSNSSGGNASSGTAQTTGGAVSPGGATSAGGGAVSTGGNSNVGGTNAASGGAGACVGTSALGAVTPADLYAELQQATHLFLLINVLVPPVGSIAGTDTNIVYTDTAGLEAFIGTDKSQPVVLYCKTGHTSTIAGNALISDGYCNVSILTGGIDAWEAAGYPVQ